MRRALMLFLVLAPVLSVGCPDGTDGDVDDTVTDADTAVTDADVSGEDTAVGDADAAVETDGDATEDTEDADVSDADTTPLPGEFGWPCIENEECNSGWCVDSSEGPVCTKTCLDDCPTGWSCLGISGEQDVTFVCVPRNDRLCQPCAIDGQCGNGYCLTLTDGRRCTAACGPGDTCPTGYRCEDVTSEAVADDTSAQCVPVTGGCDCIEGDEGIQQPCSNATEAGTCWGFRTCLGADGWSACDAPTPSTEVCDGVDNNCNLLVDENLVDDTPCTVSNDFGACEGRRICSGYDGWVCVAATPAAEVCNYTDDDCDGQVDEGFLDADSGLYLADHDCGVCGNDCEGFFPNAISVCSGEDGLARCVVESCAPGFYQAGPTTCLPVVAAACLPCTADANCVVPGNACISLDGGSFCGSDCSAGNLNGFEEGSCPEGFSCTDLEDGRRQCLPDTLSCSCLDAEDIGETRPCTRANAHGTCAGQQICSPDAGGWTACTARVPATETCNGIDDDCDGFVDEDVLAPTAACAVENDSGRCTGDWSCGGLEGWICDAATPEEETCNYQDDDCDGETDETFVDETTGQYVMDDDCGLCGRSCDATILFSTDTSCVLDDGLAVCIANACEEGFYIPPDTNRVCIPTSGATACSPCSDDAQCAELEGGACTALDGGNFCTRSCGAPEDCGDGYGCVDGRCLPTSLSCSCLAADAGVQRPCANRNGFGTCTGTSVCDPTATPGWSVCSAAVPAPETCNGNDDNCNGQVDELLTHDPTDCTSENEFGLCAATYRCEGEDGWQCPVAEPMAEACNFLDDNCDGHVDEAFRDDDGRYVDDENCGTCGASCVGVIPNATAHCVLSDESPRCQVASCDEGYYQAGPLTCLPATDTTCVPCANDANCPTPGDLCLALDGGMYCGRDCGPDNVHGTAAGVCGDGFVCTDLGDDVYQCVPESGSCTCLAGDDGNVRTCSRSNDHGTCYGTELCATDSGWEGCTALVPAAETCNGVDDDCNGQADEGLTHDPPTCSETNAFGTCSAPYTCGGADGWQCVAPTPAAEACDFEDNDCDDEVDEDFRDASGVYVDVANCGSCGISCVGAIPNATAACVALVGGSARCEVDHCDTGYFQASLLTCLPAQDTSCMACTTDASCPTPGDRCLTLDGGKFCGRDCSEGNAHGTSAGECADSYSCQAVEGGPDQCVPISGSCTCLAEDDGDTRTCSRTNPYGTCFGAETCDPSDGWGDCTSRVPAAETCNGQDDDCDGQVDEAVPPPTDPCAVTVADVGTCTATWTCLGGDGWSCPAETPAPEACNFLDDDCDGETDEIFRDDEGRYIAIDNCGTCGVSCVGALPNATATCVAGASGVRCEVAECDTGFYQASATVCLPSSIDTCAPCASDGDCPTPGDRCVTLGSGQFCGQDCSEDNAHGLPTGQCQDEGFTCTPIAGGSDQCVPLSGACDCLPANDGDTRTCSRANDAGTCYGLETCDPGAGWHDCTAKQPADETCNGQDDDCDGQADEDVTPPVEPCENAVAGIGTCSADWSCQGTSGWICPAATPTAEACNFSDDDCDGAVDEDFRDDDGHYVSDAHCGTCGVSCDGVIPNATAQCVLSGDSPRCEVASCDVGYYLAGPLTCLPATDTTCVPCADDANCPTPGDRCLALDGGKYCGRDCGPDNVHGTTPGVCDEGYTCADLGDDVRQCIPESGSCTCLAEDEGDLRTCSISNDHGTCYGTELCAADSGWAGCTAQEPRAEICNGADDDCNGLADEGLAHDPATCSETNAFGTCTATYSCAGADGWRCVPATPEAEACDFQDNDCDDEIDEDFRNAEGTYVDVANCGSCGISCVGAIPNATATCVALSGGSARCEVDTCDTGYYRASALICLPATDASCLACASDASCPTPGDRCLPLDGGDFCGRDCSEGNAHGTAAGECPDGYACEAIAGGPDQCVPISGSCTCLTADDGETRTCSRVNTFGTCFGAETCDPSDGWGDCTARLPAAETCNGQDDDCDGQVDEAVEPPTEPCAVTVEGVGTCAATWMCQGAAGWSCPAATPEVETCNFLDDDCDGQIDEVFRDDEGRYVDDDHCGTCGVSCDGALPNATAACVAGEAGVRCEVAECDTGFYQVSATVCLPSSIDTCTPCVSDGDCATPGDRCVPIGGGTFCGQDCGPDNAHGLPAGECQDEGFTCTAIAGGSDQCVPLSGACDCLPQNADDTRTCNRTNDAGTCYGLETCDPATGWYGCTAKLPADETCNGQDDDCDGQADEGVTPPAEACENAVAGVGTCSADWSCQGASGWVCPAATPASEACNFLDDDCDGETDEVFRDDAGRYVDDAHCGTCGVSCDGAIPNATATCVTTSGAPRCEVASCDTGYYEAGPLTCLPASDNICTSCASDDNCPTPGDRCLALDGGTFCGRDCAAGNVHGTPEGECPDGTVCVDLGDGVMQCAPTSGSCTCLAGDGGETRTCIETNAYGTCYGSETCDPATGWVACTARVPAVEVCDEVDNDCNSAVDDVAGRGSECAVTNPLGTCLGTRECTADDPALVCNAKVPTAEVCNYVDDDCDGGVDEGFANLNTSCYEGDGACRRFGFYVCAEDGSGTVCNAVAGSPTDEVCDNIDNDCDGDVDEHDAGLWDDKGQPCTDGLGVCEVTGVFACSADGQSLECSETPPTPAVSDEVGLCNGLDDDCDGDVDEDFPTKGELCWVGDGVCRAFGNYICNAAHDDVTCTAVEGSPTEERCDLLDNDCDGQTDNGFVDASGKYYRDDYCGNCFTDCTTIYAKANAYGTCDASAAPTCRMTCCKIGATDPACAIAADFFDLNEVPDDGCEFALDADAIYVSATDAHAADVAADPGAGELGCGLGPWGTGDDHYPCASIGFALARAGAEGRSKVLVADGLYQEQVQLVAGISLLGAFRADNWERHVGSTGTTIRAPGGVGDRKALVAVDITEATLVEGFVINGANAISDGANSYAVYVRDSSGALELRDNLVFAGLGAPGAMGDAGLSGANGVNGAIGNATFNSTEACETGDPMSDGGVGGTKTCQDPATFGGEATYTDVSGGDGGYAVCPERNQQEGSGLDGLHNGGDGGPGGWGHTSSTYGSCSPTSGQAETGTPGGDGTLSLANDGGGGGACSDGLGTVNDGEWRGLTGDDGGHGGHGAGGGGGGAGGGQMLTNDESRDIGGTGGGGGSGGCGAEKGYGGAAGGGSFGIFVYWSTGSEPDSAADVPSIHDNVISRNQGGPGGGGGNGGAGGDPGTGGLGGPLGGYEGPIYCIFPGAKGGFGSRGGHGGGGGGGCGGASFDILAWGINGQPHDFDTNTFPNGTAATGGEPGEGGNSSNTDNAGDDGADGGFGTIQTVF